MFAINNHNDTAGLKNLNHRISDLGGEPLLYLWAAGK
jgi:hypothetical protein